ncbi:MAG: prepilin-type N-terminal cleavage/methylation domain-containing protein [Gammaproteobacteria bacterium]|nr:prepilin-type N-terminal cleavage/methylation domain-containing protein [Gammaproteobacteria bacterium]MDE2349128.1 prepilin-type N-terminal cleavage/methylation domain-containing protein [Gammaproteobacteria bacterium]
MALSAHRRRRGFTLIELIVAMVIAAILAAIAIPAYSSFVRKGRRTDAKSALLDLASLEERYFTTNNTYSSAASDLGYGSAAGSVAWPAAGITVGSGYYQVSQPHVTPATPPTATAPAGAPASYSITAAAIGDQANDTDCATFTIDSAGDQTASTAGNAASPSCWQ